jgi:hypothetical protein
MGHMVAALKGWSTEFGEASTPWSYRSYRSIAYDVTIMTYMIALTLLPNGL